LKASEYKEALDPHIKRAAQTTVNKIKTDIKKQNQVNNMPVAKKEETVYVKASTFDGLKEIVDMKKQKAVANELDSLIYEQEILKNKRNKNTMSDRESEPKRANPLEMYVAANPEKIKNMSMEEITKLSMLMNPSGGTDPLMSILLMNMDKKGNNGGGNDLTQQILGVLVKKMLDGNNGEKKTNNDTEIFKLMMQQNMQTQQMMMSMIMQKNEAPAENSQNTFMKEMFGMQREKSDFENSFLKDKIRELEIRSQGNDPLGEAKRMIDYVKTFGSLFGGQNTTPEAMEHELKLRELNFEQQRQVNEESRRVANMEQIGTMINNTIETFGKVLGEPIAEAAKSKIEQFTEDAKHPKDVQRVRISPEQYQQEIDLGDLENMEQDLAQFENAKPKNARFKVYETGD
jgi:hypothetical protein